MQEKLHVPAVDPQHSIPPEVQRYPYAPFVLAVDVLPALQQSPVPFLQDTLSAHRFPTTTVSPADQYNISAQEGVTKSEVVICDGSPLQQWSRSSSPEHTADELEQAIQAMKALGVNTVAVIDSPTSTISDNETARYEFALSEAQKHMSLDVVRVTLQEDIQTTGGQVLSAIAPVLQTIKEVQELERLEIRHDIAEILKTHPAISKADASMLHWLSLTMQNATSLETAKKTWRSLASRNGRNIDTDFSAVQQGILRIPDTEIEPLFEQTQTYLADTKPDLRERVISRMHSTFGHNHTDRAEVNQTEIRTLDLLRQNGVRISISPRDIEQLKNEYTDDAACPVLDRVKNKKIATINGLTDSKISLSIHDVFDHFWTYNKLGASGILGRYQDFLQSVGNPQATDMYGREAELIATISFEWRGSHLPERDFRPIFSLDTIKKVFQKAEYRGLSDNQQSAQAILSELDPKGEEATRLESMYSGILVELMEQRRKHGFIRRLDRNFQPVDNLPLLDPEYLALIVETNHLLCDQETRAQSSLLNTEILVEDYLIALAKGELIQELVINIQDIENFDPTTSRVSQKRLQWLEENTFHTATRADECD